MAEIIQRDGTWTFDGDTVRIVPGGKAHPVRLALGEIAVPVRAVAGISFEPDSVSYTQRQGYGCAGAPARCCGPPTAGSRTAPTPTR